MYTYTTKLIKKNARIQSLFLITWNSIQVRAEHCNGFPFLFIYEK